MLSGERKERTKLNACYGRRLQVMLNVSRPCAMGKCLSGVGLIA